MESVENTSVVGTMNGLAKHQVMQSARKSANPTQDAKVGQDLNLESGKDGVVSLQILLV